MATPSTDDFKSLIATLDTLLAWPRKVFQGVWQQGDRSGWVVVCRGLQDSLSKLDLKADSDLIKADLDKYEGLLDDSAKTEQIDALCVKLKAMRDDFQGRIDKK